MEIQKVDGLRSSVLDLNLQVTDPVLVIKILKRLLFLSLYLDLYWHVRGDRVLELSFFLRQLPSEGSNLGCCGWQVALALAAQYRNAWIGRRDCLTSAESRGNDH